MKKRTTILAAGLMTLAVGALLAGCPTQPGTFEVWVINTSGAVTVTNVTLIDNANAENRMEFPDDLGGNMARVLSNIDASPFEGGTITVEVMGQGSGPLSGDVETSVDVTEAINEGDAIIIVLSGEGTLGAFGGEFVPLTEDSKGMLLMRQHAAF